MRPEYLHPDFVSAEEAAEILCMDATRVCWLAARGQMEHYRFQGSIYFHAPTLRSYINRTTPGWTWDAA